MYIAKSKGVKDMGSMEEKMKKMREEIVDLRLRESTMREKLQMENKRLKEKLQEKEGKLSEMASLAMEATQYRYP